MKLYDLGVLAIIVTMIISGITGAIIEDDKDLIRNEKKAAE